MSDQLSAKLAGVNVGAREVDFKRPALIIIIRIISGSERYRVTRMTCDGCVRSDLLDNLLVKRIHVTNGSQKNFPLRTGERLAK